MIKNILRSVFGRIDAAASSAITTGSEIHPTLIANRDRNGKAALIFIHGFQGNITTTWKLFLEHLLSDSRLNDWDIYCVGYPTKLSIDLPIWTSDPEIQLCAAGLATKLKHAPLNRYKAIALIAHSMGGLVVQRAILDSEDLRQRLRHVVLYGTPSAGVAKANLCARLKAQARDMADNSEFITRLRADWRDQIGENPNFSFTAVAGETDAFIPPSSSIVPFPMSQQAVVPGNHLEIIRPNSTGHLSYELLYKTLAGMRGIRTDLESARLAVEHKTYDRVIRLLTPNSTGLDPIAITTLALALESVGRADEALEVIQRWNEAHTEQNLDPIGVLAGRVKRQWLVSRQEKDFNRALELYMGGLKGAEAERNHSQAYYHAINIAFLRLAIMPEEEHSSLEVRDMAKRALEHVRMSNQSAWSFATAGEAYLMLGDLERGVDAYRIARKLAKTLRECDSMYMQAIAVAARIFGTKGTRAIEMVFGQTEGAND